MKRDSVFRFFLALLLAWLPEGSQANSIGGLGEMNRSGNFVLSVKLEREFQVVTLTVEKPAPKRVLWRQILPKTVLLTAFDISKRGKYVLLHAAYPDKEGNTSYLFRYDGKRLHWQTKPLIATKEEKQYGDLTAGYYLEYAWNYDVFFSNNEKYYVVISPLGRIDTVELSSGIPIVLPPKQLQRVLDERRGEFRASLKSSKLWTLVDAIQKLVVLNDVGICPILETLIKQEIGTKKEAPVLRCWAMKALFRFQGDKSFPLFEAQYNKTTGEERDSWLHTLTESNGKQSEEFLENLNRADTSKAPLNAPMWVLLIRQIRQQIMKPSAH